MYMYMYTSRYFCGLVDMNRYISYSSPSPQVAKQREKTRGPNTSGRRFRRIRRAPALRLRATAPSAIGAVTAREKTLGSSTSLVA